jgi:uncharacterized protein (TIGR02246 family)
MSTTLAANPDTSTEKAAVQDLLTKLFAAWGDADAYASFFTEDGDYVAFDGTHWRGRHAIAEGHRPLFERFLKGSHLYTESSSVRLLTPDVALVHAKGAVLKAGQQHPGRGRLSIQTLVAVRQGAGWHFAAFQNTRHRPFADSLLGKVLRLARIAPMPADSAAK